jgi:hypothetical protein
VDGDVKGDPRKMSEDDTGYTAGPPGSSGEDWRRLGHRVRFGYRQKHLRQRGKEFSSAYWLRQHPTLLPLTVLTGLGYIFVHARLETSLLIA